MSNAPSDFDTFMEQREAASTDFVNGEYQPLDAISTHRSPASIFGPRGDQTQGADAVNAGNAKAAERFQPGGENAFEVFHSASDNSLAYWVGLQRSVVQMKGKEKGIPMDLRVTEIFRKEDGEWKLIHRHADPLAKDSK